MTDHDQARKDAAKKTLADQQKAREATAKMAPEPGKPTPTQEENDLAALGVHTMEKDADGSPEQPPTLAAEHQAKAHQGAPTQHRSMSGGAGGAYDTRQNKPKENA